MPNDKELQFLNRRHKALFDEFQKWKSLFEEVRDNINPYLGYFEGEEANSGKRRDDKLICTNAIKYCHILAAGMQWGITSPTRPWVEYALPLQLMKLPGVAEWLDTCAQITLDILDRSNFYAQNHQLYLEAPTFGTGAMLILEDNETVIHCQTFTMGEYAFGVDDKGRPNSFARNIKMTVEQIVDKYGKENCPQDVQNLYDQQRFDVWKDVKHLIVPNKAYDPKKMDNKAMRYRDYHWMAGNNEGKYLRDSGFNEFPISIARWAVNGADIYGTGPGIWTLKDGMALHLVGSDIYSATELGVKPPIQAPVDVMKQGGINILPAGANYYNPNGGSDGGIKPVFQVALDIDHAVALKKEIEEVMKQHYCVPVFQWLLGLEGGTRTATEIQRIAAEQMTQMGPMLERLQNEYLPSVLDRVWAIGQRLRVYPPPPPSLQRPEFAGMPIKIKYVSILAQSQQNYMVTPIMSTLEAAMKMAIEGQRMDVYDNINFDESMRLIATNGGAPPSVLNSPEKIQQIREQRAQQQQMEQMAAMGMAATQGAKNLGAAKMDGDTLLKRMAGGGQ